MCTAIEQDCLCDGCQDELEFFYDCYITDVSGGSCSYLSCDAYEPTDPEPPVPSPVPPPVNPPTPPLTKPSPIETIPMNSENISTNIGPIVGGAIGGLAIVCATFLGICYMQKQKRGRREQSQFESNKQSAPDVAEADGQDHPPRTIAASTAQPSVSTWATPDSYQPKPPPQLVPTRDPSAGPGELGGAAQHSPPQSPDHMPNFKDQARSVAPPVPPVVEATPLEDFFPHHPTPERRRAALDP